MTPMSFIFRILPSASGELCCRYGGWIKLMSGTDEERGTSIFIIIIIIFSCPQRPPWLLLANHIQPLFFAGQQNNLSDATPPSKTVGCGFEIKVFLILNRSNDNSTNLSTKWNETTGWLPTCPSMPNWSRTGGQNLPLIWLFMMVFYMTFKIKRAICNSFENSPTLLFMSPRTVWPFSLRFDPLDWLVFMWNEIFCVKQKSAVLVLNINGMTLVIQISCCRRQQTDGNWFLGLARMHLVYRLLIDSAA